MLPGALGPDCMMRSAEDVDNDEPGFRQVLGSGSGSGVFLVTDSRCNATCPVLLHCVFPVQCFHTPNTVTMLSCI